MEDEGAGVGPPSEVLSVLCERELLTGAAPRRARSGRTSAGTPTGGASAAEAGGAGASWAAGGLAGGVESSGALRVEARPWSPELLADNEAAERRGDVISPATTARSPRLPSHEATPSAVSRTIVTTTLREGRRSTRAASRRAAAKAAALWWRSAGLRSSAFITRVRGRRADRDDDETSGTGFSLAINAAKSAALRATKGRFCVSIS